eukprot:6214791-Pleurochrysis_carterae.AAC.14
MHAHIHCEHYHRTADARSPVHELTHILIHKRCSCIRACAYASKGPHATPPASFRISNWRSSAKGKRLIKMMRHPTGEQGNTG